MKKYIAILLIPILFFSCRKDKDMDGPALTNIFGSFSVLTGLQASSNTVDFSAGESVHFTCDMSRTASWKLQITGLTSGSEKIVEGLSQSLNASEFTWDGSTTNLPLFKSETCAVQLTFDGQVDTLSDTISITQPKVNSGFLVADFETGFNAGWTTFVQSGGFMDFQIKNDIVVAAESSSYFNMEGEVNWDWLIGLVNFHGAAYGAPTYPLNSNPETVFFNAMIYGDSTYRNSLVLFQFDEDDNEDGSYSSGEDRYAYEINVDWVGWKLVSMTYADIADLVAPGGNGIPEPNKLMDLNMLHLANPASGLAKSKLDYIIFTDNAPLTP